MIATNVLSRVSRASAPVMQYQRGPSVATSKPSIQIQGETLRTWAFKSPAVETVQVELGTEGRPLEATLEVWNAAGNTPFQARVYSEDGELRPISATLEIPRGPSTVAIRNIGQMEFPLSAGVDAENVPDGPDYRCRRGAPRDWWHADECPDRDPPGAGHQQAGHRAVQREWFGPAFLRHVRDALVRQRRAHPQHGSHGVPPDRLGRAGRAAGLITGGSRGVIPIRTPASDC